jgi:hypothetical protein
MGAVLVDPYFSLQRCPTFRNGSSFATADNQEQTKQRSLVVVVMLLLML